MRELFFAQYREGVVDQESRRVEHDQNFGDERFDRGLACFLGDAPRDVSLMRKKNLLETAQHSHAIADSPRVPLGLRGVRSGHSSAHFGRTSTVQFAQNFARRRVHGGDAGQGEFDVGSHLRRSVRGTERARHIFRHIPFHELSSRAKLGSPTPCTKVRATWGPSLRSG